MEHPDPVELTVFALFSLLEEKFRDCVLQRVLCAALNTGQRLVCILYCSAGIKISVNKPEFLLNGRGKQSVKFNKSEDKFEHHMPILAAKISADCGKEISKAFLFWPVI